MRATSPSTTPACTASLVDLPIAFLGAFKSTTGIFAAALANSLADVSSPGAMIPPSNSP